MPTIRDGAALSDAARDAEAADLTLETGEGPPAADGAAAVASLASNVGELPLGVVLPDLKAFQRLVAMVCEPGFATELEFTYGAPLYKGNDAIVEALKSAVGVLEKFNAYFEHGILDEVARVKLAQKFRARYLQRHPGSEGSDVYMASSDVLQVAFVLDVPRDAAERAAISAAMDHARLDAKARADFERGMVSKAHLRGRFRFFLDHVYNPRRRALPQVREKLEGPLAEDPVIVELVTDGALPGYFKHRFTPLVEKLGGALVWLPG